MPSKLVTIHAKLPFAHEQQADLKDWFSQAYRSIGSFWENKTKRTGTGLTFEEEALLLPHLIDVEATDREFRKKVVSYFEEISTKVSIKDGRTLQIGLIGDTDKLSIDNMPISVEDYVRYRHAAAHPEVGASESEGKASPLKKYYILDASQVEDQKSKATQLEDKALAEYLLVKDKPKEVDMILTLMGVDPRLLSAEGKGIRLKEQAQTRPDVFYATVKDTDLQTKYMIEQMISAGLLERVGTRILNKEGGKELGRDMKETVLYLKDAKNSGELNLLKARMKEFAKSPISE